MLRDWIQKWLGLDAIRYEMRDLGDEVYKLRDEITLPLSDLAALLRDEHDPVRKKLSNKIGAKVEARLKAEDMARRHTLGET